MAFNACRRKVSVVVWREAFIRLAVFWMNTKMIIKQNIKNQKKYKHEKY
jgi:hypothetical protein